VKGHSKQANEKNRNRLRADAKRIRPFCLQHGNAFPILKNFTAFNSGEPRKLLEVKRSDENLSQ
jgi:hypothetical protein